MNSEYSGDTSAATEVRAGGSATSPEAVSRHCSQPGSKSHSSSIPPSPPGSVASSCLHSTSFQAGIASLGLHQSLPSPTQHTWHCCWSCCCPESSPLTAAAPEAGKASRGGLAISTFAFPCPFPIPSPTGALC